MSALLRILFAFFSRTMPFLSVAGSALTVVGSVAGAFVTSSFSRLWGWGLIVVSFLLRYFPVLLFATGIALVSNLLLSLVAFVLYHVNALLTLGLSPFVTVDTVRIIGNAALGVVAFYLLKLAVFLGSGVAASVPSIAPQAPA